MTNSPFARTFATVLAAAVTLGSGAITTASHAATPGKSAGKSVAISYADLNLASESGQQELDRRIDRAVRSVCGMDDVRTGTRLRSNDVSSCYAQALQETRERVAQSIERNRNGG